MHTEFAIETSSLRKIYRSRFRGREIQAVSDLTLRVLSGAKFGLLGANGAGKTTFVKMLLSAVNPTSGTAKLFGRDARDPEARRPVGYLPENHRFPTYLTGQSMLDFYASLSGMPLQQRRRRVPELLETVGLKDWGDVCIRKFSKGMLQRLGLAQALMHKPRLLILDEPTDGVDPVGRRQIRDLLSTLTGTGVTVFLNSHLLSEVETFCDHVAILKKGELALEGKISDLIAGRGYRITVAEYSGGVFNSLRATGIEPVVQGDFMQIQVLNREDANRAIDQLRAAGAMIEGVMQTTSSLEDVFIQTTGNGKVA